MEIIHFNHMNATTAAHEATENHLEHTVQILSRETAPKTQIPPSRVLGSKTSTGDLNSPGSDTSPTP